VVYKFHDAQPRDACIMWLQQEADVGDQEFDPYAIFASGLRQSILTSRHIFDNKPRTFGRPASGNMFAAACSRVLVICGVLSFVQNDSNAYVVLFEIRDGIDNRHSGVHHSVYRPSWLELGGINHATRCHLHHGRAQGLDSERTCRPTTQSKAAPWMRN
jgi:hypothetical protein